MSAENWKNKDKLQLNAKEWNEYTKTNLVNESAETIKNSIIYDTTKEIDMTTKIIVVQDTSQAAIFKTKSEGKMAVLNFASYKKPGGGYIDGAMAQEESLCHCSNLYNIISDDKFKTDFYEYNNAHLNQALYDDRSIYSPNVVFFNSDKTKQKTCDVITCAAPNRKAAQQYQKVPDAIVNRVMKKRILHILKVAMENKVDTLILGAFGCGVFGNDSNIVSRIFKECLTDYYYYRNAFKLVVFAIPDTPTYTIFKSVLS